MFAYVAPVERFRSAVIGRVELAVRGYTERTVGPLSAMSSGAGYEPRAPPTTASFPRRKKAEPVGTPAQQQAITSPKGS